MLTLLANSDQSLRTVYDAFSLRDECVRLDIETDWWFHKANTIRMLAGEQSSEAYLLLTKADLDGVATPPPILPIKKAGFYNHKIRLEGTLEGTIPYFDIAGWAYHSHRCVIGSNLETDTEAIFLVRFCDARHFFAKQPCQSQIQTDAMVTVRTGFNIVDGSHNLSSTYDESSLDKFPYDPDTLREHTPTSQDPNKRTPYTWDSLLRRLWHEIVSNDPNDPPPVYPKEFGATMGFSIQPFPTGGSYPDTIGPSGTPVRPIDIRFENKTTWGLFCELLHSVGNEIYPLFDGTFAIRPIDEQYNTTIAGSEIGSFILGGFGIDNGFSFPEWKRLPDKVSMTFYRRFSGSSQLPLQRNRNSYGCIGPLNVTSLIPYNEILSHGGDIASGVFVVQSTTPGSVEDYLTMARPGDLTLNTLFARYVYSRYYRACLSQVFDVTFPCHVPSLPQPLYNEVLFYFDLDPIIGAPSPRTHFLTKAPPSPGVESIAQSQSIGTEVVAITASIAAAQWKKDSKPPHLIPVSVTSPYFYPAKTLDPSIANPNPEIIPASAITFDTRATPLKTTKYVSEYTTAITVTSGKFRVGTVEDGILMNVDCTEQDFIATSG